ncbi:DNA polymerase III subunit epsilon [Limnobacter humi]|uniref:DNA polymerase III subunit epsilon n=1 Tax=Limnobacter humi TaxID=1778671 RepID=A0ABT1WHE8_9BURK|nr:DNA polymerase III subunit epsilon [Limnobacter humi]MCQ8896288.1 DNA polymerase III subunit epsilon [Limnobacter humi]
MRYVVLDTETTGLEVRQGHRIIEIGCIEVAGRQVTNKHFHEYVNPQRAVDEGAFQVHGISDEMLADKPVFSAIAERFLNFVRGSTLIIHNAAFDIGFLDGELDRLNLGKMADHVDGVIDSLTMAREMFPGKRNNLDALCDRLGVNNSHRQFHGALLDSQILAEVYLAMTRGQDSLVIDLSAGQGGATDATIELASLQLPEPEPGADELALHARYVQALDKEVKGACIWTTLTTTPLAVNDAA